MSNQPTIWVDFDSSPRVVWVPAPIILLSIQDLVDTLRIIEAEQTNMSQPVLLVAAGKDNLGGGVAVGITCTLLNAVVAFEGRAGPDYTQCEISGGNLVAVDDLGVNISAVLPTAFTQIIRTSASSATLQEQDAIDTGNISIAVWSTPTVGNTAIGSMGAALAAAGAGGVDPSVIAGAVWGANANAYVSSGSMGSIMSQPHSLTPTQEMMLLEMFKLLGLDPAAPLVVTQTARTAGNITQTIGSTTSTTTVTRV